MQRPRLRDLDWRVRAPGVAVLTGVDPGTAIDVLRYRYDIEDFDPNGAGC